MSDQTLSDNINAPDADVRRGESLAGAGDENADRARGGDTETGAMSVDSSALGGAAGGGVASADEPTGLQGEGAR